MALSRDRLDREKPFTDLEEEAYVGKIVTVEYVDDFDGQSIEADVVDTVDFSFRGKDYSLVLTAKNGAQFDKDMAPYIRAAKKAQARDARGSRGKAGPEPRQAGKRKAVPGGRSRLKRCRGARLPHVKLLRRSRIPVGTVRFVSGLWPTVIPFLSVAGFPRRSRMLTTRRTDRPSGTRAVVYSERMAAMVVGD